jgi:hypothetical protein
VTSPDPETVAMAAEPELHATVRPVKTLLEASRVVAFAWVLPPTIKLFDARATLTDATAAVDTTGCVTVTNALPLTDPRVAMIEAVPGDTPRTRPLEETVATAELLELHPTVPLVATRPRRSRRVAVARVESPTAMELDATDTEIELMNASVPPTPEAISGATAFLSEQERTPSIARAIATTLECVRLMSVTSESRDAFSQVPMILQPTSAGRRALRFVGRNDSFDIFNLCSVD